MPDLTQNFQQILGALMPDYTAADMRLSSDPLMKAFPPAYNDADLVQWDIYGSLFGLLPLRGLDAEPDALRMPGWQRYAAAPGYFGGFTEMRESEIVKGRQPGTVGDPVDVADRLGYYMRGLSAYTANRLRKSVVDLLVNGSLDIRDANGRRFSYKMDGYANQIKVPGTTWSTFASATPVFDLLTFKAALEAGTDSRFGADSVLLMNSNTLAEFFQITQIVSTYRTDYGSSIIGLEKLNRSIQQGFTLPQIAVYDEGYYPTEADAIAKTNFTKFLPNRTAIWLGTRPEGQVPGQFQFTRHAGNEEVAGARGYPEVGGVSSPAAAELGKGLYVRVHYHNRMPHHYDLEAGFNGLPIVYYPSAFAVVKWS